LTTVPAPVDVLFGTENTMAAFEKRGVRIFFGTVAKKDAAETFGEAV